MRKLNQKGLTLIEVLVSILILAGGCVYVLQALAQSAKVQKQVENRIRLEPFTASKLEWLNMRISSEKDPFKVLSGSFFDELRNKFQWDISSNFLNPIEAKAPVESLGKSVLLVREISLRPMSSKSAEDGIKLSTYFKATVPETRN